MQDMDQFKATYITECFELLEEMEERLLGLDDCSDTQDELNAIFRCAHSIKGGAGAFGFNQIVSFTHILEALLDAMRDGTVAPDRDITDALLKAADIVTQMVTAARDGTEVPKDLGADLAKELEGYASQSGGHIEAIGDGEEAVSDAGDAEQSAAASGESAFYDLTFKPHDALLAGGNEPLFIIRELLKVGEVNTKINYEDIPPLSKIDSEKCYLSWSFDIDTDKGEEGIKDAFEFVEDECDLEISEFAGLSMPGPAPEAAQESASTAPAVDKPQADNQNKEEPKAAPTRTVSSIRVDIDKVDRLVNMVGEVVITQTMIAAQMNTLPQESHLQLHQGVEGLAQHTRELQEAVMSLRMQPVKSIFSRMPRLVRDLSAKLNKDVRIVMSGENTEIDKTVIEQLGDPLTHMIRNSLDHGIDTPDERRARGVDPQGTINLSADHRGGSIVIEIEDDGRGINREVVLSKAIEKGLVPENHNLEDEEIDNLIFHPGFSTAAEVTDVSGRGVGMDVVKNNIADLGGTVAVENRPGEGATFYITLPLTLAILDGMIVRVGQENYIVPINNIIESLKPQQDDVKLVSDGSDVINVRGEFIPIVYLHRVFNTKDAITDPSEGLIVLVESGRHKFGLVVDELIGQQQVVIKSIEENTDPIEGVSGATILGDGHVSFILDIAGLQRMAGNKPKPFDKKAAA